MALAVKLGLARQLAASGENESTLSLLEQLRGDVQGTVQELRELAYGIDPPLLRDRGLEEAMRAAAARPVLPCTVSVELPGRYPEQVEIAAYFCCLEAMQNADKYAGAAAQVAVRNRSLYAWVRSLGNATRANSVRGYLISGRRFRTASRSTSRVTGARRAVAPASSSPSSPMRPTRWRTCPPVTSSPCPVTLLAESCGTMSPAAAPSSPRRAARCMNIDRALAGCTTAAFSPRRDFGPTRR